MTDSASRSSGDARDHIERETKILLDEAISLAPLEFSGFERNELETLHLDATYFDTEALDLERLHCGLRRRRGIAWTFKGPSHDDGTTLSRRELEAPDAETLPEPLRDAVTALGVDVNQLTAVARMRTERRRFVLIRDGHALLEIDDDLVEVLADITAAARAVARYREVEVEVVDDAGVPHVDAVVAVLLAIGGSLVSEGKYNRALRLLGRTT